MVARTVLGMLLVIALAGCTCCCSDAGDPPAQETKQDMPADDATPTDAPPGPSGAEGDGPGMAGSGGGFDD